jgi:hypothetical protein
MDVFAGWLTFSFFAAVLRGFAGAFAFLIVSAMGKILRWF